MLVGGVHISGSWLTKPEPRLSVGAALLVWAFIGLWGWLVFGLLFAALADFGSAAMNFVSTNISASIS